SSTGDSDRLGADVLFEIRASLRARNRHDVVALRHHPRQCELTRRAALVARDLRDLVDELQVVREVVALEPRRQPAEIVLREVVELLDLAGENAAAERAVRDEADAELAARGEHAVFWIAGPQRVFGLDCGDRMNLRGAAQRLGARLRQPDVADLAG